MMLYQFAFVFFGLRRTKRKQEHDAKKSFAVIVAAHNEEQVIGALLDNLKLLDYPKHLYDILVICDNCTDSTVQIVRDKGCVPFIRKNLTLRGKGHAIEWMLNKLWDMPRKYDAVVMFDADNLVDCNFLREMNNDLCSGARVIQGYLDVKNPEDSWITASYGACYWYTNRFWQLSRNNLNMACYLGGTGMCFDTDLLKEVGWGATSLVEDLEFTMRSVQRNVYPVFNYDAKVYDEKPLTLKASSRQRLRWMQGHFVVARRYSLPLMWQAIKERSLVKFDLSCYAMNVYGVLVGFLVAIERFIHSILYNKTLNSGFLPSWFWLVSMGMTLLTFMWSLFLERVKFPKVYVYLLSYPIYLLTWFPITVYAFFTQNNKEWSHTEHTRVLQLDEVQTKEKVVRGLTCSHEHDRVYSVK